MWSISIGASSSWRYVKIWTLWATPRNSKAGRCGWPGRPTTRLCSSSEGKKAMKFGALAAVAMLAITACGSSTSNTGSTQQPPPTANMKPPTSIGAGEGALNLIDWGGYVQSLWQKPFEDATGCKINFKDAASSDEMVSLMAGGGGGNWDMVSASGDADLRLIYNGSIKPMNVNLIPAWPIMTTDLHLAGAHTADTIPSEGATGWADTWMLATNAPHPNCAYKWAAWVSTAKVQAEQAINYGETPVNTQACAEMESLKPGSCAAFHANAPETYFNSIKFWKTPISTCDDGTENCMTYAQWQSAWTTIKG